LGEESPTASPPSSRFPSGGLGAMAARQFPAKNQAELRVIHPRRTICATNSPWLERQLEARLDALGPAPAPRCSTF